MLRKFSILLGCLMVSVAAAQDGNTGALTDPTEILKKADDASKAVKFVKYTAEFKATGGDASRTPSVEGTVVLNGLKNGRPEKWHYDLKARLPGSEETRHVVAGTNGDEYFVLDSEKKIAYVDIDPAVLGSAGRYVQSATMLEYVHETPFTDEINGEKKELKGTTKIGDEECYEIYVKYAGQGQEANWFFSKKDFLPRRVDRKFAAREGAEPNVRQLTVTSLTVDPKFDNDPFKFELPEGYTKSDDFAP